MEVFLLINGDIGSNIYARQEIGSNGTVSLANSLRLQRGTLLNLKVSISEGQSVEILPIAAFGIVMLSKCNVFTYKLCYRSVVPNTKFTPHRGTI